jgi:hypothetical protein
VTVLESDLLVFSQLNGGALLQHQHLHFPWGLVHLQQFVYEIREVSMLSVFVTSAKFFWQLSQMRMMVVIELYSVMYFSL